MRALDSQKEFCANGVASFSVNILTLMSSGPPRLSMTERGEVICGPKIRYCGRSMSHGIFAETSMRRTLTCFMKGTCSLIIQ